MFPKRLNPVYCHLSHLHLEANLAFLVHFPTASHLREKMSNTLNIYGHRSQTSSPPSSKLPLSPMRRSSVASSTPTLPPVQEDDESLLSRKRRPLTAPSWYSVPLISNRTPTHFYHSPGVPASPPQQIGGMPQRGSGSSSSATPDLITHLRRSLPLPQYHRMSENGRSYPSIFVPPPSTSAPSLPPSSQLRYIEPERAISRPPVAPVSFPCLVFSFVKSS